MIVRVGTVDGMIHETDPFSRAQMQAQIDEVDGYIFTGDMADNRVDTVDEAMEVMTNMLEYDKRNNYQNFHMTIDGRKRSLNVAHVVWWEVVD